jgi:hypothetical protein
MFDKILYYNCRSNVFVLFTIRYITTSNIERLFCTLYSHFIFCELNHRHRQMRRIKGGGRLIMRLFLCVFVYVMSLRTDGIADLFYQASWLHYVVRIVTKPNINRSTVVMILYHSTRTTIMMFNCTTNTGMTFCMVK